MKAVAWYFKIRLSWLGKDTLFSGPHRRLLEFLGGIPIHRNSPQNSVSQVVEAFKTRDSMILSIAPEGTRSKAPYWKSGFYHIAMGAKIPLVCGFIDYARKEAGVGPTLEVSGNMNTDLDQLRNFYQDKQGRFSEQQGPICFNELTDQSQGPNNLDNQGS